MSELAVTFDRVGKSYSHFALKDVSFRLERGRIMGFVGPNGAGKSTTIRILMGLICQDAGAVTVLDHAMPDRQMDAKWDIGFVSEDMRLYAAATLKWHMDLMASLYSGWDAAYADTLVKRFHLRPEQTMKRVSHGERVKALLMLALARRPRLLVLDEPTTGLDPVARRDVLSELMDVVLDEDRAILFSSHNTLDVEQISDQITFIDQGRIIRSQDKESFFDEWRRLRIEAPADFHCNGIPEIVDHVGGGRLGALVSNAFSEGLIDRVQQAGATVTAVERMTLEEIFVANVIRNREGMTA